MTLPNSIKSPKCFNRITGKTDIVTTENSIRQSLALLLQTSPGELFGDPNYGTPLSKLLFETNTSMIDEVTKSYIISAVNAYEPRITMVTTDIVITHEANILTIQLSYTIKNTDIRDTLVLQLATA